MGVLEMERESGKSQIVLKVSMPQGCGFDSFCRSAVGILGAWGAAILHRRLRIFFDRPVCYTLWSCISICSHVVLERNAINCLLVTIRFY